MHDPEALEGEEGERDEAVIARDNADAGDEPPSEPWDEVKGGVAI